MTASILLMKNTLETALPLVAEYFDQVPQRVYKLSNLRRIFIGQKQLWNLHRTINTGDLVQFLMERGKLSVVRLETGANRSRSETRYAWGHATLHEVALSLQPNSYFSHHTALYLNGLITQEPDTVYVNHEQPRHKASTSELIQENIDRAFRNEVRVSHNIALYQGKRICLLNGMYTGQCGVVSTNGHQNESIRFTGVARTLIDIAVRPVYAGGVENVLMAFRLAKGKVIIKELVEFLQRLQYKYPYHQVVGFYLDRCGVFENDEINQLRDFELKYDFYLVHGMEEITYSRKWRLYYPKSWESTGGF